MSKSSEPKKSSTNLKKLTDKFQYVKQFEKLEFDKGSYYEIRNKQIIYLPFE